MYGSPPTSTTVISRGSTGTSKVSISGFAGWFAGLQSASAREMGASRIPARPRDSHACKPLSRQASTLCPASRLRLLTFLPSTPCQHAACMPRQLTANAAARAIPCRSNPIEVRWPARTCTWHGDARRTHTRMGTLKAYAHGHAKGGLEMVTRLSRDCHEIVREALTEVWKSSWNPNMGERGRLRT